MIICRRGNPLLFCIAKPSCYNSARNMSKRPKRNIPIVRIITVTCLIGGLLIACLMYYEASAKNDHDTIKDRLDKLEASIVEAEEDVDSGNIPTQITKEYGYELLNKAKASKGLAQLAWNAGQYDDAQAHIDDAYIALRAIPEFPTFLAAIVAMILSVSCYLLIRRKLAPPVPS